MPLTTIAREACTGLLVARSTEDTEGDVEQISGVGANFNDEVGSEAETLAFFGCGLVRDPKQRGLSK